MAKKVNGLSGVGNKLPHQCIISDLIFGARKKLVKSKLNKKYYALPEITLSELGLNVKKLQKDYNIDFVIYDKETNEIVLIAEIERNKASMKEKKEKMADCLNNIKSIKEAYFIKFDKSGKVAFENYSVKRNELILNSNSSRSEILGLNLKSCLVS